MITDWYTVTINALQSLWLGFWPFIIKLLGALIVFIIGWFISVWVGRLIAEVLIRLKFNKIFEKGNWKEALEKAEFKVDASAFVGAIIKWVLVIVFLQAAVGILNWTEFAKILEKVIGYLPNVIVAVLIFVVTVILVDIIEKVVRTAIEGVKVGYGQMVSAVVKWAIWIFAIATILNQLNIGGILPQTVITGVIGAIALAIGLSFGLGGKEVAAEILADLKKKIKK